MRGDLARVLSRRTRGSSRRRSCSRSTRSIATILGRRRAGARARAFPRRAGGQRGAALGAHARSSGRSSRRARASSRRSTSARSRGKATRSFSVDDGRADPVPARGDRDREQHATGASGARSTRRARQLVAERARADAARALPARARHHRSARTSPADYNATFELLSGVSLVGARATSASSSCATRRRCGTRCCPEFVKRVLGMTPREATRADALALFRAREFDAYFPASDDGGVDPPPGARDGHRSATPAGASLFDTGEREGKRSRAFCAPVRVPRRGVSRAAPARRADRLAAPSCTSWDTRCTSRTCAPTIRSSIAGWATTR